MNKFLAIASALVILTTAAPAQAATKLPRVWVGGPNPAPCTDSKQVHGKWVGYRVACYQVRPAEIALTEDGNDFLSDLTWSSWEAD